MLKNDFFGFPKVHWLHRTTEVDKSVRHSCQIFSGFNVPKLLKSHNFDRVVQKKKKGGRFADTVYFSSQCMTASESRFTR